MRAFVLVVDSTEVDVASDALWQLGVRAIEERLAPATAGAGDGRDRVELRTSVGDDDESIRRAVDHLAQRWDWRVDVIADETSDASRAWREFAAPMWIDDRLVVVPAWLEHESFDGVVAVSIEPGGAFGLGDHPTTRLSLRALRPLIHSTSVVLDVGCGTGVLAITAAVFGARHVCAVDIASAAVEATLDNAERNGVRRHIDVDTTPVDELDGSFDVVVANILAPTLISMADELRRLTSREGRLVISGILADRHEHVLAALAPMMVERTDVLDGWACVTLRHPR